MSAARSPAESARWGLVGDVVFDGAAVADRPTVLIDGGRVVAVGAALPESIEVVECTGATILPGLVDCHQHLCFDGVGTLEEQVSGHTDDELAARARASARSALAGGVTTIRDLGDRGYVTLDLRGDEQLPNLLASGPPITAPKGHCWYLGGECAGDDLADAVDERVERGCDVVKIMVTGGALTPTWPPWRSQFSLVEVRAVVDRAHAAGLSVAAHCHGVAGIRDAVAAGVDTIEHCTFLTEAMESAASDDLLDELAASDTALSATLGNLPRPPLPPQWQSAVPRVRAALGRIHTAGGTVLVGTDAGINPYKPHDVMPRALADLVDLGMTPLEGLTAMTSRAADTLGLPDVGRLSAGAVADVIAVDGDPFSDPGALTAIARVWRAGVAIGRPAGSP